MRQITKPVFKGHSVFASIVPKRQLGQVFLADQNITDKIISACQLKSSDTVLEIGPGPGTLTHAIAQNVREVIAIETDRRFYEDLKNQFEGSNVKVIHADFLKFDLGNLPNNLIAIGNLPYYISSPIIGKLLEYRGHFTSLFITVQLEFANRMVAGAHTKDYSALSCLIQYYTDAKKLFKIKNSSFRPVPKVDSCFMHLMIRKEPQYKARDESFLFKIIHQTFQKRRKTLPNAFAPLVEKERLYPVLAQLNINQNLRPENLSIKDFVDIANTLHDKIGV